MTTGGADDFSTLQPLPASFVTEHLGQDHADMLWRVRTIGGEWLYLMVLIEFQSTIDRRVAPRSRYVLIELQALDPSPLPPDNILAMIAKFEQAQSPEEVDELVALLADWLERVGEPDLVERFRAWITLWSRRGSVRREGSWNSSSGKRRKAR